MKKLALLLILTGCLSVPDADAQVRDSLLWVVAPFEVPSDSKFWWHSGAEAMQDVFVTELAKGTGYRVRARQKANRRQRQQAFFMLTGAVTEYGVTDRGFVAAVNARIFNVSTGEVLWRKEAQHSVKNLGERNKKTMFDKVMKPVILELTASIKAADL